MQQRDEALAVGVEEAEVAGPPQALGQDVLDDEPEEVGPGKGALFELAGSGVSPAVAHLGVVEGEDVLLADDAAVEIAAQVDQGGLAGADALAVDDPLPGMVLGQAQGGGLEAGEHPGAEDLGESLVGEEVGSPGLALALGAPELALGVDGGSRHDEMDVGVEGEFAGVGVQHGNGAGQAVEMSIVLGEGAQRLPGAAQEKLVDDSLVGPGERAKLGRKGEGKQEVLCGKLPGELAIEPALAVVVLAVGAVSVAAGMGHESVVIALGAGGVHLGAGLGAAELDGGQGAGVFGTQAFAVLSDKRGLEALDDRGETDHLSLPH